MTANKWLGVLILSTLMVTVLCGRKGFGYRYASTSCQDEWKQGEYYDIDLCTRCQCWSKPLNSSHCTIEECGTLTCEQEGTEIYQPPHKCCPECVPVTIRFQN